MRLNASFLVHSLAASMLFGCTFYTACPNQAPPEAQAGTTNTTGGSVGGGGGGTGGSSGGTSNVIPGNEDKAQPWVLATSNLEGLESECGNLGYVSVKPDEDAVIAGVARRGLFVSRDDDAEWVALGEGEGSDVLDNRTSQLLYDPENPQTFWQAGAYGPCVYRTDDGGETFQRQGDAQHCDSIAVDFTDPRRQTLLAGGHEGHNLFLSYDGGATWEDIVSRLPADSGNTGFATILDTQTFLVASWNDKASGVYRSEDAGETWDIVWEGGIRSRPLFAKDGTIFWVLSNQDNNQGLIRSDDQGRTFTKVEGSDGILSTEQALVELPDGRLATVGMTHLLISDDQGESWKEIGKKLPFTPWGMTYSVPRKRFYIWHFDCGAEPNPVSEDAIMTLAFDPAKD